MKAFNKLFCVLLTIILMLSVVLPCFAKDASLNDELEAAFTAYCTGKVPMHIDDVKEVSIEDVYTAEDVVVFSADSWKWKDHGRVDRTLLGYDITVSDHHFPYDMGVYVYTDNAIRTLEEAVDAEIVTNLDFLNDFYGISCIHQSLTEACSEAFLRYKNTATTDELGIKCYPLGTVDEYTFFRAKLFDVGADVPTIVVKGMIGDYIYHASEPYGPEENPTGLYAMNGEGLVFAAYELYEAGILTDEQIAQAAGGSYSTELDKRGEWEFEEIILPALAEKYPYTKGREFLYSEKYVHYTEDENGNEIPEYALIYQFPAQSENEEDDVQTAHIVNDMVLEQNYKGLPFTYGYGIYIFETGEFHDFLEVPQLELEGKSNIYKSINYRYRMGDNNEDYNLTIQDATYMQKCLAGLQKFRKDDNITEYFNNPEKKVFISDYNRDGVRNVKDVTAIQKRIAGITSE